LVLSAAVLTGAVLWVSLPYITSTLLTQTLHANDWNLETFHLHRPVDLNLRLDEISIVDTPASVTVLASGIVLRPGSSSLSSLAVDIDQLTIEVAGSDEESPMALQGFLDSYISVLPLAASQGQIRELKLCLLTLPPCVVARLTWWHDINGLQGRIQTGAHPLVHDLYLEMTDHSSRIEFFQSGEKSIAAELLATWPDINNVHLTGAIQSTDDTSLEPALVNLPGEKSIDLHGLSVVFDLKLPLETIQQPADLMDHISGDINIDVSGNFIWKTDEFSLESNQPIVTRTKVSPDKLLISIAPHARIKALIPDLVQGAATNQQEIVCDYQVSINDLSCTSSNLSFTADYMSAPVTASLLVSDFTVELPEHEPMSAKASIVLEIKEASESVLNATGNLALQGDQILLASSSMSIDGMTFDKFELIHSLDSNQGELAIGYSANIAALKRWIKSPIQGDFVVQQQVTWKGSFDTEWQNWSVDTTSNVIASNLDGEFDGYLFKGGELNLTLTGWLDLTTAESVRMSWKEIDVGLPMHDTDMSFNLSLNPLAEVFDIQGISAKTRVLGGAVHSDSYAYNSDSGDGYMMLTLDNLDLLTVLSLEQEDFYAEGKLNGRVPVTIKQDQIYIEDGAVEAIAPGGIIQYKPSDSVKGLIESNSQMALVVDTLKNFRYDTLKSKVDFRSDGILHLSTSLTGSNPDFEGGRKINFNLNVEENIAALLESLRLSEDITNRVEEQYKD